ncbi:MAG TPA: hypothetical protein VII13_14805 [Vicinamibacteria bacterium]|jgi:hypothetical protein
MAAGAAAALAWLLLCLRWFDAAVPARPAWVTSLPPWLLALATTGLLALWLVRRWPMLREGERGGLRGATLLLVVLAAGFRLPLAWWGSAGYVAPDGALSGIVALRLARGAEHYVFVPHVAYSGSLKSHLAAALMAVAEPSRAFALASVAFYALFVAGVHRLALLAGPRAGGAALRAGLLAAFAPAFVTQYSLSNDGNYVEVLALGTWALYLAVRWARDGGAFAVPLGLLLGLALWCHLLAVVYAAAIALLMVLHDVRRALRDAGWAGAGVVLGYLPGLIWNATHGWASLAHFVPGERGTGLEVGLGERVRALVLDELPILLGYDLGFPAALDVVLRVAAASMVALVLLAVAAGLAGGMRLSAVRAALLLVLVNVGVALFALPYLPGNPRYLLFLMTPLPLLVGRLLHGRAGRAAALAAAAFGAVSALLSVPDVMRADARWRRLISGLETAGFRHCYSDFFNATKINFLSAERVVCSAKLGPTTTEYFFEYREEVDRAPAAALVPVNRTAAEKLERRLERLGVAYERRELSKAVILPARKVDPAELFPDRDFPLR